MKQQPNRREQHYYKSTPNHEAACEAVWLVEIFPEYELGKLERQCPSNHGIRIVPKNASTDYAYLIYRAG